MNAKDYAIAVNKFFYFANNWNSEEVTYPTLFRGKVTEYIPAFFQAFEPYNIEHLLAKFNHCYELYGCRGVIMGFYAELDGENRARLLQWAYDNFQQSDDFGINLSYFNKENENGRD